MRKTYNNYRFSEDCQTRLFNTNCVLYLVYQYLQLSKMPSDLIDVNMRTDYHKLRFLVIESRKLNGNFNLLSEILRQGHITAQLTLTFSVNELIESDKFISLLFYLGFLSIEGKQVESTVFGVPNDMCREILWEFVRKAFREVYSLKVDKLEVLFRKMTVQADWEPLIRHIFEEFYAAAANRDFIYREEGVKGFFLAYLNLSKAYRIHSETAIRGHDPHFKKRNEVMSPDCSVDIYIEPNVQIYPDMNPTHFLFELKYVSKTEVKAITVKRLAEDAARQLARYAKDHKLPSDTVKIAAVTTNEELVYLSK
jgi:hypothetical protein